MPSLSVSFFSSQHFEPGRSYWIGASDQKQETVFEWSDGRPFNYASELLHQANGYSCKEEAILSAMHWFQLNHIKMLKIDMIQSRVASLSKRAY